jgi:hypothetical protein
VRRGGAVVSVRAEDADVPRVESLLENSGRVDIAARGAEYRSAGWQGVVQPAPVLTPMEVERQRLGITTGA